MSEVWLAVALVGTFVSILMVGLVIDMTAKQRGRPVAILESHVGPVTQTVDMRQQALEGSVVERILMPVARRMGRLIFRLTPLDIHGRISELLVYAGNPPAWDAERVVAFKIIGAVVGGLSGLLLSTVMPLSAFMKILGITVFAALGYVIPSAQLQAKANGRQKWIQRQLPDVMDLLTISVEAGLGLDAAISQVIHNVPGPLAEELARLAQEMQIGVSRSDAFRNLGERTTVQELRGFVLSMIQADLFGVSIGNVLRAQSRELRQKRRQRAEELAQKVPVKLLFPMIFLVLPATFVIILGPGVLKIYDQFFGGSGVL